MSLTETALCSWPANNTVRGTVRKMRSVPLYLFSWWPQSAQKILERRTAAPLLLSWRSSYRTLASSRSFMFFHAVSGPPRPCRTSLTPIFKRILFLSMCSMPASHPNPPSAFPPDSNDPTANDVQEQPLTREELEALIDFFRLLDAWDKNPMRVLTDVCSTRPDGY